MEIAHPGVTAAGGPPPALLVSLHDVSPLTLELCEQAVALMRDAGLKTDELTVLVIPRHEGQAAVDQHPPTVRFLRGLADDGARLVMHGLTHRMTGRALTPAGIARAHIFARGQGELYNTAADEVERRLAEGAEILHRAGIAEAARAFVPPAWLLSPAGRTVVRAHGFDFFEVFGGIVRGERLHARRVIGWGSLGPLEAIVTAAYAWIQCRLPPADTRLAIHPADMRRAGQRRAIRGALARLLPRMRPASYSTYLDGLPAAPAAVTYTS
jgi:predicted deacetylase